MKGEQITVKIRIGQPDVWSNISVYCQIDNGVREVDSCVLIDAIKKLFRKVPSRSLSAYVTIDPSTGPLPVTSLIVQEVQVEDQPVPVYVIDGILSLRPSSGMLPVFLYRLESGESSLELIEVDPEESTSFSSKIDTLGLVGPIASIQGNTLGSDDIFEHSCQELIRSLYKVYLQNIIFRILVHGLCPLCVQN